MANLQQIVRTNAPAEVILIRLVVGGVFLSEGIQKFVYADDLAAGRFARIGIPSPRLWDPLSAPSKLSAEC